jgi:hypothetical protein
MMTDSPGTIPELKILVSAVRFRPWPHSGLKHFNRLQALRSWLNSIFAGYFAIALPVFLFLVIIMELLQFHGRIVRFVIVA